MASQLTIEDVSKLLDEKLKPVMTKLDKLHVSQSIIIAKMANAAVGREEPLTEVPAANGHLPGVTGVPFPASTMELMVAGNESLPDGRRNSWNARWSKRLLRHYGQDVDSDSESELSQKSRDLRLQVAKVIGITRTQLNYAQLSL